MSYLNAEAQSILRRTKVWSEAIVKDAELEGGVITCDVTLVPDEQEVTVEFCPLCPGFFRLPKEGEEVLIAFVDADRTAGYLIGHTGPSLPEDAESGVLYVWAPDDEKVVIQATGEGSIELRAQVVLTKCDRAIIDSPDVRLGGATASDPLVRESRLIAEMNARDTKNYRLHQHMQILPLIPAGTGPTLPGAPVGAETVAPLGKVGADNVKGE